jgi:hypothetical protein
MRLVENWRAVLQRAWSVRLLVAAGALSGLEIALPYLAPETPSGLFAGLSALATMGAFIARIVAQRGINDVDQ